MNFPELRAYCSAEAVSRKNLLRLVMEFPLVLLFRVHGDNDRKKRLFAASEPGMLTDSICHS